jgi:hypothetical protein
VRRKDHRQFAHYSQIASSRSRILCKLTRVAATTRMNPPRIRIPAWRGNSGWHEAKLAYCGNVVIENRNGLVVDTELLQCNGTAERDAAMVMAERLEGNQATEGKKKLQRPSHARRLRVSSGSHRFSNNAGQLKITGRIAATAFCFCCCRSSENVVF